MSPNVETANADNTKFHLSPNTENQKAQWQTYYIITMEIVLTCNEDPTVLSKKCFIALYCVFVINENNVKITLSLFLD